MDAPLDVLLMPEGNPDVDHNSPEARAVSKRVSELCLEVGRAWDDRPANLARALSNAHVVALDFGEECEEPEYD